MCGRRALTARTQHNNEHDAQEQHRGGGAHGDVDDQHDALIPTEECTGRLCAVLSVWGGLLQLATAFLLFAVHVVHAGTFFNLITSDLASPQSLSAILAQEQPLNVSACKKKLPQVNDFLCFVLFCCVTENCSASSFAWRVLPWPHHLAVCCKSTPSSPSSSLHRSMLRKGCTSL
jgi:hypothetical protein